MSVGLSFPTFMCGFFFFFYVKLLRLHAGLAGEIVFFYILQEKTLLGNNPVGGH